MTAEETTRTRVFAREIGFFALFVALTVGMTWPWAADLRANVMDRTDTYECAFLLWWEATEIPRNPAALYDAPIFFPHRDALALSENHVADALPLVPLALAGARPLTLHSVAILLGFALSGYAAFRLARELTGSTGAALVAGIGFAFTPYRFAHVNHVAYLSAGWMALAFEAMVLFVRRPSRGRAAWMGGAFLLHGLACITYLLFSLPVFLVAGPVLAWRGAVWRDATFWRRGAAALGVAAIGLALWLAPYRRVSETWGFKRSEAEAIFHSGRLANWIQPTILNRTLRALAKPNMNQERGLFPGFLLLAAPLFVAGTLLAKRRPATDALVVGGLLAAMGLLGSLGMNTPFHRFLFEHAPLFGSVRVPMRWMMLGALGLALLLAAAAAALFEGRRRAASGFACVAGLLLFEQRSVPLPLTKGDTRFYPADVALAGLPARGGLAEFPMRDDVLPGYVLRVPDHRKPLVTAKSSFEPPPARRLRDLGRARPVPDQLLDDLEKLPTSYLLVHESLLPEAEREPVHGFLARALAAGRLRFIASFAEPRRDDLYAFVRVEPAAADGGRPFWLEREDATLPGSVDEPAEGARVVGPLTIRGWARAAGADLDVSLVVDGVPGAARVVRVPRPDVGTVLPHLGDTSRAGFEASFPSSAAPGRTVEVVAVFRAADGRTRHYPLRRFFWTK